MTVAGWYPDPVDPNINRYWDGAQWTPATQPRHIVAPLTSQTAPHRPAKKKPNKTLQTLAVIFLVVFLGGIAVSALDGSDPAPKTTTRAAVEPSQLTEAATPTDTSSKIAGPRDTITYADDGLAVTVTALTEGPSTNQFDGTGTGYSSFTLISFELRNVGNDTLDAADWYAPYLNYGPGGASAEAEWLAGTVNGLRTDDIKGSGLIPPGGIVTATFAYQLTIADLSQATITPRWPGRMVWTGNFAEAFAA
ncbi:DUF2510 domain-containing protein [Rhodococcoides kyotonense]|uniref:DUF2510 domain-containing protein n=1 Tax=Rhodococcoides kyotonense TaxID=398843 RepID=A0A239FDT5_9NOCA|nr:DUF2510 domain-containing protein [Rhodococcus kyotonensis]SNS54915.1 Protein of unknown function [Rhodococcus kyotonensis]